MKGNISDNKVKRTERGWAGHFCMFDKCLFRRNTLLEHEDLKVVVSTVGLLKRDSDGFSFEDLGCGRYFETIAFHADYKDKRYHDADVSRPVYFASPWYIKEIDADDKANTMHENVVKEIEQKLLREEIKR